MLSVAAFTLQQQSWNLVTDCMAHKAENIYYLALYSKSLPTPGLSQTGYFLLSKTVVKYTMFLLCRMQYVRCSSFSGFLPKPSNRLPILHLLPFLLLFLFITLHYTAISVSRAAIVTKEDGNPLCFSMHELGRFCYTSKASSRKKKSSALGVIWKISHHFFQAPSSVTTFYVSFINTTAPSDSSWDSKLLLCWRFIISLFYTHPTSAS